MCKGLQSTRASAVCANACAVCLKACNPLEHPSAAHSNAHTGVYKGVQSTRASAVCANVCYPLELLLCAQRRAIHKSICCPSHRHIFYLAACSMYNGRKAGCGRYRDNKALGPT